MAKKGTKVEQTTKKNDYVEERRNLNEICLKVEGKNFAVKESKNGKFYLGAETPEGKPYAVSEGTFLTTGGKEIKFSFNTLFETRKEVIEKIADGLNKAKEGEKYLTLKGYPVFEKYTYKDEERLSKEMTFETKQMQVSKYWTKFKGFIIEGTAISTMLEKKEGKTNDKDWTITTGEIIFYTGKPNADEEKDEYNARSLNIKTLETIPASKTGKAVKVLFFPSFRSYEGKDGKTHIEKLANVIAVGDKAINEKIEAMGKPKENKVENTDVSKQAEAPKQEVNEEDFGFGDVGDNFE